MIDQLLQWLPPEGVKILLTLFLCFLIGLEREEHQAAGQRYSFGGVRTFPLIGLIGYALALLSGPQLVPLTAGLVVVGAFLWLSYRHKLETYDTAGATTEVSALATYVIGALVSREQFWIATTLAIISILLLELKQALEALTTKIPGEELLTFSKFLLLTFVILPIVPNRAFWDSQVNPFKVWLIVVAVSGVSYGGYLLEKAAHGKGGIILSGVLGGAYSSTFTTIVLGKRARESCMPHAYSGAILLASGVMYLRFLILIAFFNAALTRRLAVAFLVLGVTAMIGGWLWSRIPDGAAEDTKKDVLTKNPLELPAAFSFAVVFVLMLVATRYALLYLGRGGMYGLAGLSGLVFVDPFVMGLTQQAGKLTPMGLAAAGVVIALASNNLAKAIFALSLADSKTGRQSFALLLGLTLLSLLPLLWIAG